MGRDELSLSRCQLQRRTDFGLLRAMANAGFPPRRFRINIRGQIDPDLGTG